MQSRIFTMVYILQIKHDFAEQHVFERSDGFGVVNRIVALEGFIEVRVGCLPILLLCCMDDPWKSHTVIHTCINTYSGWSCYNFTWHTPIFYLTACPVRPVVWAGSRWHWPWFWRKWGRRGPWAGCWGHGMSYSPTAEPPPAEPCHPSSSAPAAAGILECFQNIYISLVTEWSQVLLTQQNVRCLVSLWASHQSATCSHWNL